VTTPTDERLDIMARTNTPTPCPTCGALTFRGVVSVRVWRGDNGAERYYPAGDHAEACARRVEGQRRDAALVAEREAARARDDRRIAAMHRWGARVKPIIASDPERYAERASATIMRMFEVL
jgi:hypothetical protein